MSTDAIPESRHHFVLSSENVVTQIATTNALMGGWIEVTPEIYDQVRNKVGACKYADGGLTDYAPQLLIP